MKGASGARGIEPAVGTAPAHLAVNHNTGSPRAMSLATVLARCRELVPGDMREEGLDIAPPTEV